MPRAAVREKPMNESDWLTSTDPRAMLDFLRTGGQASERKLRLFGVACCRRVSQYVPTAWKAEEMEVVERYADGLADEEERRAVHGWNRSLAISNATSPSAFEAA